DLGAGGHAADRLVAALAHVDLVEVGLHDLALVVAGLQQQRVDDLVELAGPGLLAADAEHPRARELLGQGAAALAGGPGAQVDPGRAHHAAEVDAVVATEVAVLHRLQRVGEQHRDLFHPHQPALLLAGAVEGGDAGRVQAHRFQRSLAARRAQAPDAAARAPPFGPPR